MGAVLPPFTPELGLGVPGFFARAAEAGGGFEGELKGFVAESFHGLAVKVATSVDVHLGAEEVEARGGGHDLKGGDEGEVSDGAVAGSKKDEVALSSIVSVSRSFEMDVTVTGVPAETSDSVASFSLLVHADKKIISNANEIRFFVFIIINNSNN